MVDVNWISANQGETVCQAMVSKNLEQEGDILEMFLLPKRLCYWSMMQIPLSKFT